MKKIKVVLFCVLFLAVPSGAIAQSKPRKIKADQTPQWVKMMNDTSANYNEVIKSFRTFFKDRPLPHEAGEVEGSDMFEKEIGLADADSKSERERELKTNHPGEVDYSDQVRAFKGWYYSVKPWVRADGSIVGPVEQQHIINKQQEELKAIEKGNRK